MKRYMWVDGTCQCQWWGNDGVGGKRDNVRLVGEMEVECSCQ